MLLVGPRSTEPFPVGAFSRNVGSAFTSLLMHSPRGSSSLSSSCAVSAGLKQRCQYGFVFNFWFCLTEEMFQRIRLLQLVPVRYSRDIRACSYLQIAGFFQPLHLNLQLSER